MKILGFCWKQPKHVEYYLSLIRNLEKKGVKFCFVTEGDKAKELFAEQGIEAFTHRDIVTPDVQKKVTHWWNNTDKKEYAGYNLPSLLQYERDSFAHRPELIKMALQHAVLLIEGWLRVFKHVQPNAVFTWNGGVIEPKIPAEIAKKHGLPAYFFERGFFPHTLVIDPKGVNFGSHIAGDGWREVGFSVSEDDLRGMREYIDGYHRNAETVVRQAQRVLTKAELYKELRIAEGKKIILFPLQIEADTNIIMYSPHFKTMPEIIMQMQNLLEREFADYVLVVKPHPEDKDRMAEFGDIFSDQSRLVSDVNLHSLIQAADVVLTINSNVGLEALTYYKPVIVLGMAIYSHKGATYDINDKADIAMKLAEVGAALPAGKKRKVDELIYYLLRHYLYFSNGEEVFVGSNGEIEDRILSRMVLS